MEIAQQPSHGGRHRGYIRDLQRSGEGHAGSSSLYFCPDLISCCSQLDPSPVPFSSCLFCHLKSCRSFPPAPIICFQRAGTADSPTAFSPSWSHAGAASSVAWAPQATRVPEDQSRICGSSITHCFTQLPAQGDGAAA